LHVLDDLLERAEAIPETRSSGLSVGGEAKANVRAKPITRSIQMPVNIV